MNDLELLDKYIEDNCKTGCVNPFLFRNIEARGLTYLINYLPSNEQEAKAILRARLAKIGKSFGDDEIDQIANEIQNVERLRKQLITMNMADAHKVIPILKEMLQTSEFILSYYKTIDVNK